MRNEQHRHLSFEGIDRFREMFRRLLIELENSIVKDEYPLAFE